MNIKSLKHLLNEVIDSQEQRIKGLSGSHNPVIVRQVVMTEIQLNAFKAVLHCIEGNSVPLKCYR